MGVSNGKGVKILRNNRNVHCHYIKKMIIKILKNY